MERDEIDYARYTREQVDEILKFTSKLKLIGPMYIGEIGEQTVRWCDDGSVEVLTTHKRGRIPAVGRRK